MRKTHDPYDLDFELWRKRCEGDRVAATQARKPKLAVKPLYDARAGIAKASDRTTELDAEVAKWMTGGYALDAHRPPVKRYRPPSWLWGIFAVVSISAIVASYWPQLRSRVDHLSPPARYSVTRMTHDQDRSTAPPPAPRAVPIAPSEPSAPAAAPPSPLDTPAAEDGTLNSELSMTRQQAQTFDLDCGPQTPVGDPGNTPVASRVNHRPWGWSIQHTLSNGQTVSRGGQYDVVDRSAEPAGPKAPGRLGLWGGYLKSNHDLYMLGEAFTDRGSFYYGEVLYDIRHGNKILTESQAVCRPPDGDEPIQPQPSAKAVPHATLAGTRDRVPIYPIDQGLGAAVDVTLGAATPVRMVIDTGANFPLITEALARRLVDAKDADWLPEGDARLAAGKTTKIRHVEIHSLKLGSHNIVAGVEPDGEMLLGFNVLADIGAFMVNTHTRELTFDTNWDATRMVGPLRSTQAVAVC
jgi:hypothetical protein